MDHTKYHRIESSSTEDLSTGQAAVSESIPNVNSRGMLRLVVILTVLFIGSNLLWMSRQWVSHPRAMLDSSYYNANTTSLRPFYFNTEFSSDNKTVSNKLWRDMFPVGAGLVTVPKTFASENGFPASIVDPEDTSHSLYLTAAYHQLHCLTVLRASIYHYREGVEQTVPWLHLTHCLDALRQSLMCNLDNTLLYSEDASNWGINQTHVCRDWDAFADWVEDHAKVP